MAAGRRKERTLELISIEVREAEEGRVPHLYGRHFRQDSGIEITHAKGNRQNERNWNQLFS